MKELDCPEGVAADKDARELLRVWSSGEHIPTVVLAQPLPEVLGMEATEPQAWGQLLGHLAVSIAEDIGAARGWNQEEAMEEILGAFTGYVVLTGPTPEVDAEPG